MRSELDIPDFEVEHCVAGTVVYPPGGKYGPRFYRDIQLVLLHSGSMEVDIDGQSYKVRPGHVMLLAPGQTITILFHKHEDSWHRWITLAPTVDIRGGVPALYALPRVIPLSSTMNQLVDLMLNRQNDPTAAYGRLQIDFGLAALRMYAEDCIRRDTPLSHPAILAVQSFVGEKYGGKLELSHMAHSANVSPSHLIRLFRERVGISPMQYLWNFRLERGLELLRTTGLTVGEIADRCGFSNQFHFSRMVKKRTGKTPTGYRAEYWTGDP